MLIKYHLFDVLLILILIAIFSHIVVTGNCDYKYCDDDDDAIHRKCNHRSTFTDQEIRDVLIYLQTRYLNGASIKPQREPCKSLSVTRDFRCLSQSERQLFISTFLEVYKKTDYITNATYGHDFYWPFVNILAQGIPWHYKITEELNRLLMKINPKVTTAYWDMATDGSAPEKALIWDYIGHSGTSRNNYCIPDGPFKDIIVKYPNNTCIKREWNSDGTINKFETPELFTYALQYGFGSLLKWGGMAYAQHFKKHVNIGGLHGDMAWPQATNDPSFHMFHLMDQQLVVLRSALQADNTLVDLTYNSFGRHNPLYSYEGTIETADIETDTLFAYPNITVAEAMTFGFGDVCYIADQLVIAILSVLSNRRPQYPPAVQRLRDALPADVFAEFFPLFANNTATELNYYLPDVGNTNRRCKPIPVPIRYNATEQGRAMIERFHQIGVDLRQFVLDGEAQTERFINTLNYYGYCSPYVS